MKMDQECIVCGAPATREAKSRGSKQTAWVCGAGHARKFLESVRPAPVKVEFEKETGQGTFLGGKRVR